MGVIDSLNKTSHKAVEAGSQYVQKSQEYYKLKIFKQLTMSISVFCKIAIIGSFILLGIVLITIAGIIALSNVIGNMVNACLIVALALILMAGLIAVFRSEIDRLVIREIAKKIL